MVKPIMALVSLNSADRLVVTPRYLNAMLCTLRSAPDDMVRIELENGLSMLAADWGIPASDDFLVAS